MVAQRNIDGLINEFHHGRDKLLARFGGKTVLFEPFDLHRVVTDPAVHRGTIGLFTVGDVEEKCHCTGRVAGCALAEDLRVADGQFSVVVEQDIRFKGCIVNMTEFACPGEIDFAVDIVGIQTTDRRRGARELL